MLIKLNWNNAELQLNDEEVQLTIQAIETTNKWYIANISSFPPDNKSEIESLSTTLHRMNEKSELTVQDISNSIKCIADNIGWLTASWNDSGPHRINFEACSKLDKLKQKLCKFMLWYIKALDDTTYPKPAT